MLGIVFPAWSDLQGDLAERIHLVMKATRLSFIWLAWWHNVKIQLHVLGFCLLLALLWFCLFVCLFATDLGICLHNLT